MDGFIAQALLGITDGEHRPISAIAPDRSTAKSLEKLLNGVPYPTLIKDRAHRWMLMNDAWCALMNRPREEMLGRTDCDLFSKEQADGYCALDDEVFETGEDREIEEGLTLSDGTVHVLLTRKRLVNLAGTHGDQPFICVSVFDITDIRRTEAALREREARYRATVELSPLIAWSADSQGGIVDVVPRWHEQTGMTLEQTLGMAWAAALHPEDVTETTRHWRHATETGELFSTEYRYRLRDGSYRWIHARATPLRAEDGSIIRWYGTLDDIHDRKLAEIALRDSEERHRYTLELSPLIPWSADAEGMVLDIGTRWCERTGLTYDETLGRGFATALHPDERAEVLGQWQHAVQTGEPCSLECRYIQADGRDRWVHMRATARRDDEGRVIRWYGTLEDIHDRKLAEIALRESELRFRVMSDDAPVAIWMCDADGLGTFMSRGWIEMTGLAEAEALGYAWLQAVHPEDRERAGQEFMAAHALCQPYRTEFRLRRADGSWGWVIDQGRPRFGVDGSFLGYVGSLTDISERRAMEAALRESEAFARSVLESSPNCIRVLDLEGSLQFMNQAGYRILEAEQGGNWAENLPVDHADEARQALAMAKSGIPSQHQARRIMRSGAVQWLEIGIAPIPDADGRPARILSIAHDVTDIRQAREAAEQAKQEAEAAATRLSSVLESTMDSVVVVDRDWRLTYLNGNASRTLAAKRPEIGIGLWDMFPEEMEGIFARQYRRAMAQQLPVAFEEFLPALNAWFEVHAYPTPQGLSIFFRDITERRRAEQDRLLAQEKITHMARHDVLTGLPNRFLFRERLEHAVAESCVSKAVLYLDLDGFKAVNDTLGHPAGDALLRLVSERLQGVVRGSDLVARLGGDEFAIVQASSARREDAQALAERILEALAQPFSLDGELISIGTSVGIAMAPQDGNSPDELLKAADVALYCAKEAGRGTFCFFDPSMDAHLQARQAIKLTLRGALSRGEFELHYQPLVDLGTRRVNSFEALLRWRHPERGMVAPADFIPVAEETGLIVPIGEWVLEEACRRAVSWPDKVGIAVNLSPIQFRSKTLVQAVDQALKLSGLEPCRLQLEITESVLLQDNAANLKVLHDLRHLGVKIAMDDFGTGYSSLSYLRSFSFDKIKLDRSFVRDLSEGPECEAIVRAVAGLASGLSVTTTAEGIETAEQLEVLLANGYNEGQGYLFGYPIGRTEVTSVIEKFRGR